VRGLLAIKAELLVGVEYFGLKDLVAANHVWGMSSLLVQVICALAFTVSVVGAKPWLSGIPAIHCIVVVIEQDRIVVALHDHLLR